VLKNDHLITWSGKPAFNLLQRLKLKVWKLYNRVLGRKFTDQNLFYSKMLGTWVDGVLMGKSYDYIIAGSGEPELIAYLRTTIPIIYIADSTFYLKLNYYPWHTGLATEFVKEGEIIESRAISLSDKIIYSSSWAAESAATRYGAHGGKMSVVPFGPNIEHESSIERTNDNEICDLLFVGKDWKRKGGGVAYFVFCELKKFLPCTLTIIGCDPALPKEEGLFVYPFLDKNIESDSDTYNKLFMRSDILLMPTFADCTPVVFSEAAAFGIPVITRQTGGCNSVIIDGITGICMPYDASEHDFFTAAYGLWSDKERYEETSRASLNRYEAILTWERWSDLFREILK
jgi:glycosyltransferase involved in cell wall biosynthesis